MRSDKEIKKELKKKASLDPDSYYATNVLKGSGFSRTCCEKCGTYFWSTDKERKVCGDSSCCGGFSFFNNSKEREILDYITVWKRFADMFSTLGYTPVSRYPVVARWNPTMDFTIASIAAFQPFVVSGEVEPPANPLVIPQFCLRFPDIDNVGYTGSHMTGFVMIGQHMFVKPNDWNQDKVFADIKKWLNDGLKLSDNEIVFHEEAWAGGGNAGPCMEFFAGGLELGNQVYMLYEQDNNGNLNDLHIKVLDMGMGHERNAWFSQGTNTIYEAVFPTVVKKLLKITDIEYDDEFLKRYAPHAGKLNLDEVDDIEKAWKEVASAIGESVEEVKKKILPLAGIFSIGEHTRSLLFALSDGALPSNVGGGYNLRILIRRSLSFIDRFRWNIELAEVCKWHAQYLEPLFPELMKNLENINKILEVEKQKYEATKQKTKQIVENIINKDVREDELLMLYDSNGIPPEMVREEAAKLGKEIMIPDNFFGKVAMLHEKKEQEHATQKEEQLDLEGVKETIANYFDDYSITDFESEVLRIIEKNVVLDKTLFYPTSGGQLHDKGTIAGINVVDVFKQGAIIVHVMESEPKFKKGDKVKGNVEINRRKQLSQNHTATHIVNAAAKFILGNHVNQAGAKKTEEKAHLDITHYQSISDEELKKIEEKANEIVLKKIKIKQGFYPRREAEDSYGMEIYQGGAVPGKAIRIVEIPGVDVEACGGTHLNTTDETGRIKILKSTKIQDGIVRITFTSGKAADQTESAMESNIEDAAKLLEIEVKMLPARAEELFSVWKKARKAAKKKKKLEPDVFDLKSQESYDGDIAAKTAEILGTQPEHIVNTISRFLKDIENFKEEVL